MATLDELVARTRLELADQALTFNHTLSGDGTRTVFNLPETEVVEASSLTVREDGTPTQQYTLDARAGVVTFDTAPANGVNINVTGTRYQYFTDDEIITFVTSAFSLHTVNRNVTIATLPAREVYLVALLAKIEALWVLATDAAYDIDIRTPEGVSVPRTQRFAQLMAIISQTEELYRDLSMALGVGIYRIEVLTLRRVSRHTGRLVPVYQEREIDDPNPPLRIFPPIDNQFATIPAAVATVHNLTVMLDPLRSFSETLPPFVDANGDPIDLSNHTDIEAGLTFSRFETREFIALDVDRSQDHLGVLTVSMPKDRVTKLVTGSTYGWYLRWLEPSGVDYDLVMHGTVQAVNEYVVR